MMHFLCIGINHTTASLDLREDLSFTEVEIRSALQRWRETPNLENTEVLILSTCNRTEIYAVLPTRSFSLLEKWLITDRGKSLGSFRPYLYYYFDNQVVKHLFRVASGLDSQVLGETQILGQVQRALEIARDEKTVSTFLIRLFQSALHAAKRVHTETEISRKPISVASLAVELVLAEPITPQTVSVLLLGAGEMAERTLEVLKRRRVGKVLILNRTYEHAVFLAARWGVQSKPIQDLEAALREADLVITAMKVDRYFLTKDQIERALFHRSQRPLKLMDIGLPRNIDPAVMQLEGVQLWDLEHLNHQIEETFLQRKAEIPKVEKILLEEEEKFLKFFKQRKITPVLAEIHHQAEQIRLRELEKTLRRLPDLSEEQQKRIEAFSAALVKKILDYQFIQALNLAEDSNKYPYSEISEQMVIFPDENIPEDGSNLPDESYCLDFSSRQGVKKEA